MGKAGDEKGKLIGQHPAVQLAYVLLFNTLIAGLLTVIWREAIFWNTLLISQCIGLTIFANFFLFSRYVELKGLYFLLPLTTGSVLGVAMGLLAAWLLGTVRPAGPDELLAVNYETLLVNLLLAFFFGAIILFFFISRERQFEATQRLKEVQIRNLDSKRQIAETQLQLLQAQIEPHFLFNSLSNVISLMDTDTPRAKQMLESLTQYLRASLRRSHDRNGTLKDELDLIENYLKILQIRMGQRLQYKIHVDEQLGSQAFPIMLMQPIVENAIKHGLEPLPEGGCIEIDIQSREGSLHIRISDDGIGLKQGDLTGFGLMNVRKRLQSLYGEAGRLSLASNHPRGVQVTMEMPDE